MATGEGFGDLADFWSAGLPLTIKGKTYVVPEPSAATGLWCQSLFSAGINVAASAEFGHEVAEDIKQMAVLDDDQETNLYRRVLGSAYAELEADGHSYPVIRHCGLTVFMWIVAGEQAALKCWQGRNPLGPTAPENRAARRAKVPRSTPTRAASAIPRQASPSGTRSRKTDSPSLKPAPVPASRGSKSSAGGSSSKPTSTRATKSTSTPASTRARGGGSGSA